ncbi:hypothetical protein TURU_102468 [Turdus rufiventris]|nr:hypothetical protein TURU_102468 [Turdus rufiventris]
MGGTAGFAVALPEPILMAAQTSCDDGEEIKSTTEKNVQIHWKVNQREDSAGAFGTAAGPWCHCSALESNSRSKVWGKTGEKAQGLNLGPNTETEEKVEENVVLSATLGLKQRFQSLKATHRGFEN